VSEAHLNGAQAFKTAVEAAGGPANAQQPQAQTGGLPPGKPPLGPAADSLSARRLTSAAGLSGRR